MSENKRLQLRISKNLLAKATIEGGAFFVYIQDLSKRGLGFACNREIGVGSAMEFDLNVPEQKNMLVKAEIAWERRLPSIARNKFQYGASIKDKPESYDQYLETLMKRQYEKRRHPRFQAVLSVRTDDVLDLMDAATENVSAGGLYIRSSKPLDHGAQYEMALEGEDLESPIRCIGEVVASFQTEPDEMLDHAYGAGIRIVSFVENDGERFGEFIRRLEALYKFHWPDMSEFAKS